MRNIPTMEDAFELLLDKVMEEGYSPADDSFDETVEVPEWVMARGAVGIRETASGKLVLVDFDWGDESVWFGVFTTNGVEFMTASFPASNMGIAACMAAAGSVT